MKSVPTPRHANLRLALLLGAVALACYGGIYLFYLLRP
jgi:hypothetical protein